MMVKIMSDSKKIKEKAHFYVSRLAGAVHYSLFLVCFFANLTSFPNCLSFRRFS